MKISSYPSLTTVLALLVLAVTFGLKTVAFGQSTSSESANPVLEPWQLPTADPKVVQSDPSITVEKGRDDAVPCTVSGSSGAVSQFTVTVHDLCNNRHNVWN